MHICGNAFFDRAKPNIHARAQYHHDGPSMCLFDFSCQLPAQHKTIKTELEAAGCSQTQASWPTCQHGVRRRKASLGMPTFKAFIPTVRIARSLLLQGSEMYSFRRNKENCRLVSARNSIARPLGYIRTQSRGGYY